MLRLMLDHHPRIACLSEFEYAVDHLRDDGGLPELSGFVDRVRRNRIFKSHSFEVKEKQDYLSFVDDLLEQKRQRDAKEKIVAVVHRSPQRLRFLWPDARYIHMLRDPRDVAASCVAMGWAGNTWCGCQRWEQFERDWEQLRQQLSDERWIEVRYEAILLDPRGALDRICRFLGESFHEHMLQYPETTTYSSPDPNGALKWRYALSARSVRLVEARCGNLLVKTGYELSGHAPLRIPGFRRAWLRAQDRCLRAWFRMRRLGPRLYVMDLLARRLRLSGLQERIDARMESIWRAHLK